MAVNESELKEHKIKFVCIGDLEETALELKEDVEVKIGKKDDRKTIKCKQITGKVSINTGNGVEVFFPTFDEIGYDGKESRMWNMALAMLDWNPKIKGNKDEPVTRVAVGGQLNYYWGYNENTKKAILKQNYRVNYGNTRVTDDMENGFTYEGDFFIAGTNENEDTGVGTIKAYYSNYNGEVLPVEITVDADDVDTVLNGDSEFEAIEAGQTRFLKVAHFRTADESSVPAETTGKKFGAKRGATPDVPTSRKYKDEYVLMYADGEPVPEPEEEEDEDGNPIESKSPWYNPKTVKKAIKEMNAKKEEIEKNPPAKKSKGDGKSDLQKAKAASKAGKGFGANKGKATSVSDFDEDFDDEDPF